MPITETAIEFSDKPKLKMAQKPYIRNLKKTFKDIGLTGIFLLYCFIISIYIGIAFNTTKSFFSNAALPEKEAYDALISSNNFFQSSNTMLAGVVISRFRSVSLQHNFPWFSSVIKSTRELFSFSYLRHKSNSKIGLVELRKTALIFPFHYFW